MSNDLIREGSAEGIEGLAGRVERYAEAHRRAVDMSEYLDARSDRDGAIFKGYFEGLAAKLRKCGDFLLFRHYHRLNKVRLHAAMFCHVHHLCPFCAIRRGAKLLRLYLAKYELLCMEKPQAVGLFVTLTVKDGEDLLERFEHLGRSVQALMYRRRKPQEFAATVMGGVLGGVGSYEFKRGKGSGLWHPHYHGVWLCAGMVEQAALIEEWREITGDSFVLDVRPLYGESVLVGFLECFKYAVKFGDMPLDDNWAAYTLLRGRRLVSSFGCFRGIEVQDLTDDPVPEDEPFIELFYQYRHGACYSFVPARSGAPRALERSSEGPEVSRAVVDGLPGASLPF